MIPTWTTMDLERARQDAKENPFKGSTTPTLDMLGIKTIYGDGGVCYITESSLRSALVFHFGDNQTPCASPNCKALGMTPWEAEIFLKNKFKNILTPNES